MGNLRVLLCLGALVVFIFPEWVYPMPVRSLRSAVAFQTITARRIIPAPVDTLTARLAPNASSYRSGGAAP
jgi:hypothetical protein